jgi:tripartite ATP-independent transporter DctM subunit
MSFEMMAPLMFAGLVVFLLIGYPVAFSLAANGLLFAVIGIIHGSVGPELLQALPERVLGIMSNATLLAIPFFTFMGLILERSGMAEDLLDTIGQLFGRVRGGVAYAVVFVGALLAATTGVVAASVLAMGLISLPVMMRYRYANWLSSGVITASGSLAQIIPPSLVLIVLADQMGASVGDFYEGALFPGLALAGCYALWVFIVSMVKPQAAPACPPEFRRFSGAQLVVRVFTTMIPPLVLIFLVLGTIFLGVATPTEGGAMGASGAILMALVKRKLTWSLMRQALEYTATMTSFVMFILVGSTVFSLVFRGVDGDLWVERLLTSVPGGALGFLIVVNALIFFLAFFLDYFEIAFIMVPLLTPVAQKLGIDLVWFGVLMAVNMQTSFLHPPFGFALFYLRSVAPKSVKTSEIYWGAVPFVVIQVLMVATIIAFPGIVTNNISAAPGAIKGSGADELRRQLTVPMPTPAPAPAPGQDPGTAPAQPGDPASELERLLKQQ